MLTFNKVTQKFVYQIPDCHNKLNQYGKIALQNREHNYRSIYHAQLNNDTFGTNQKHSQQGQKVLSKLLLSSRGRSISKIKNPELEQSFQKLQRLGLSSPKELKLIKYDPPGKSPTVHNDYHTRQTNHGFSRSQTGGIFPK